MSLPPEVLLKRTQNAVLKKTTHLSNTTGIFLANNNRIIRSSSVMTTKEAYIKRGPIISELSIRTEIKQVPQHRVNKESIQSDNQDTSKESKQMIIRNLEALYEEEIKKYSTKIYIKLSLTT